MSRSIYIILKTIECQCLLCGHLCYPPFLHGEAALSPFFNNSVTAQFISEGGSGPHYPTHFEQPTPFLLAA